MPYVIISKTCIDCGDNFAVTVKETEPSPSDILDNRNMIGNGICCRTKVIQVQPDLPFRSEFEE